jgi:hypothetical protein
VGIASVKTPLKVLVYPSAETSQTLNLSLRKRSPAFVEKHTPGHYIFQKKPIQILVSTQPFPKCFHEAETALRPPIFPSSMPEIRPHIFAKRFPLTPHEDQAASTAIADTITTCKLED